MTIWEQQVQVNYVTHTFTSVKNLSEKPEIHGHNMILLKVELKLS